jgi:dGTPase
LGHPPFGHTGEMSLDKLMLEHGGFEHNRQSLRIVEELEQKYPSFPGLNLAWEVREGLAKHCTTYDRPGCLSGFAAQSCSLESQVANLSDEIAYYSHDLDDGLEAELLDELTLDREVQVWSEAALQVRQMYGDLPDECRRSFTIRCIIDGQVKDVVGTSEEQIRGAGIRSADEVRQLPNPLVQYSSERRELNAVLRDFLYHNLYFNSKVHEPNTRAAQMLEELFYFCLEHHDEIGEQSRKRATRVGWHRAVCDYLAGMTDRYLVQEHRRIFGIGKTERE